ncbi:hypothetical protein [Rhabdothermincola salaria]|uniref:hypothetical protein n=1 Tax=Rhabdothermincola salaria TaxID=2903142 RepID=UPI001E29CFFD|nr:hypothetical protein [Rhabdothermincola salaria]MCD9622869.1 hypothetical protein [Rhabdothermincola salaria]
MSNDPVNPVDRRPTNVASDLPGDREHQFRAELGGFIRCLTCDSRVPASEATAEGDNRTEGASDPDDMLLVVEVSCDNCGAKGSMNLGFGPTASPEDLDTVAALSAEDHPDPD